MGAIVTFLGGAAFRLIWGSISDYFTAKQEAKNEIDKLTLQGKLDDMAHTREMEKMKLLSELNIKQIDVQSLADLEKIDATAFGQAAVEALKPTGNKVVDIWNGVIRPAAATICLLLWISVMANHNFAPSEWDLELMGTVLGFYFASRVIDKKRG